MDAAEQELVELESLVRAQSKDNLVENEVPNEDIPQNIVLHNIQILFSTWKSKVVSIYCDFTRVSHIRSSRPFRYESTLNHISIGTQPVIDLCS